jgi:hypothetical protein
MKVTDHARSVLRWSTAIVRRLERLANRIAAASRNWRIRLSPRKR